MDAHNAKAEKKIFSVTELTRSIKSILESSYPSVWVEGEVSNFSFHRSGHMYLTLKDQTSALQASLSTRYQLTRRDGLTFTIRAADYANALEAERDFSELMATLRWARRL